MLNPEKNSIWRATRLKNAMQNSTPPVKPADLARRCDVSKQVVHGWLKTGRIDKKFLPAIAELIKQPLEYLLDESYEPPGRKGQRVNETAAPYEAQDRLLVRINKDWSLLSDMDRRRIYNDVTQKADHVRAKIKEHDEQQPAQRPEAEASNESVINRVVGFMKRPRKPRS